MSSKTPLNALDVIAPVTVFRILGLRPSAVYVDADMQPSTDGDAGRRLWDNVYLREEATVGDQIQDGSAGLLLVDSKGHGHPVQLCEPEPRAVDTAFTHAGLAMDSDRERIRTLMGEGVLCLGSQRRLTQAPFQPGLVRFGEEQPLVVDDLPDPSASVVSEPPQRRRWSVRRYG